MRLGVLLAMGAMAIAAPARAERSPARLVYERDAALVKKCPDERTLRDLIAGKLGYDPFDDEAPRRIEIAIRRGARGLRGTVALVAESGPRGKERVYNESPNACPELASTLALTASILLDPTASSQHEPAPAPAPAPEAARGTQPDSPVLEPPAEPPPARPEPQRSTIHGRVGGGVIGTVAAEPEPSAGVTVSGGLGGERFSFDLEGRVDLPRETDNGELSASASLLLATLAPCIHFEPFLACVLGSGGALYGSVERASTRQTQSSVYAAVGARFGAELPLAGRLALAVHADALATLTRTSLDATGSGSSPTTVWVTPPLSVALAAGALYRF